MASPATDPAAPDDLRARLGELTLRDEHRLRRRLDRARRTRDPEARAAALRRLADEVHGAEARVARRRARVPAVSYPDDLPVAERREDLLAAIRDHPVVVVAGETGSGKTTQLPKLCLELGRGVRGAIAHTQPRRLAARTVAQRIADELDVPLGGPVGYAVRFNDRSGPDTLVRLVTDGLLLAEVEHDRALRRYDTIIVDEAHERSLNVDFLLGYLHGLLPRRPELKLIITSATIDPGRFAAHFGGAPVVEVSGRTYPVEVRYRPLAPAAADDDEDEPEDAAAPRDPVDAIGDAVEELLRDGPGDVLVFLSGEREIRDTAEALGRRLPAEVDVLALYARLAAADQSRVFAPHDRRRVVLATNVAETSLTVPGIRSVVDPGLARISRYSSRLKVQRLPIEPVSQASAAQRAGRCGRTGPGICVRLYSEDELEARPAFTDPEVARTSLAAVILRMAALGLGDPEAFPFLDPPDARQVRDGVNLLHELAALEPDRRLTPLGRRLARLPVDPRLGRMVLEADRLGAADEVIVIAAALSIPDPRERPAEERAQADALHARFADPDSDFLALLSLWRYLGELGRRVSGSQLRKRCRAEHLNYLRVREWQDLVAGLRDAGGEVGVALGGAPAEPETIHRALLAGLLSHLGLRDERRRGEYQGARGARFAIFPGSALARRGPTWVMVAELVETGRLWGRTAARVEPGWIEAPAAHLLRRSYDAPRWERRRAAAVASERATLYGLPVVAGRSVALARVDPAAARELFIRCALVEGEWDARHAFREVDAQALEEVRALEHRTRRGDLLVGDDALYAFFDARVPTDVRSGAEFDAWWREERRRRPDLLDLTRADLIRPEAARTLDPRPWPTRWRQGELELELSYRYEPDAPDDGVTVHVPLAALGALRGEDFDWLVPGLREELVVALLRARPKEQRRALVPVPDVAAQVLARVAPRREELRTALSREVRELRGVRVDPAAWALDRLPVHLRPRFVVHDARGAVLAEGRLLADLRARLGPRLRAELRDATRDLERHGLRDWSLGTLPREVALLGTGVRAYPALRDEGDAVGVAVLDTPEAQAAAMQAGTRRLLGLVVPSPLRAVRAGLDVATQLRLAAGPHGGLGPALQDAAEAAVDLLVEAAGGPAWDAPAFSRLRAYVAEHLVASTAQVVDALRVVLEADGELADRLARLSAPALAPVRRDVERQRRDLLFPGFLVASGAQRLGDVARYLRAAARRLERAPGDRGGDRERMGTVHELEDAYHDALAAWPAERPVPSAARELRWALQELRVSLLAPGQPTRGPASPKRVRRLLADLRAAA